VKISSDKDGSEDEGWWEPRAAAAGCAAVAGRAKMQSR